MSSKINSNSTVSENLGELFELFSLWLKLVEKLDEYSNESSSDIASKKTVLPSTSSPNESWNISKISHLIALQTLMPIIEECTDDDDSDSSDDDDEYDEEEIGNEESGDEVEVDGDDDNYCNGDKNADGNSVGTTCEVLDENGNKNNDCNTTL